MIRTVLRTEHVTMQFGGVIAVNDLNIVVKEHEIIALIGPNGAGKTTAFNDITGVYTPTKGRVIYTKTNGQEIDITAAAGLQKRRRSHAGRRGTAAERS